MVKLQLGKPWDNLPSGTEIQIRYRNDTISLMSGDSVVKNIPVAEIVKIDSDFNTTEDWSGTISWRSQDGRLHTIYLKFSGNVSEFKGTISALIKFVTRFNM